MFRVGFGDFFLLSVPIAAGAYKHILIDCGVHAKDLGTIADAVSEMAEACNYELALVIVTHRHADHISGFGTCRDIFKKISVDRVWMSWFENPGNKKAAAYQASLTALAAQVANRLAVRRDPSALSLFSMVENITGKMDAAGRAGNQAALDVIHGGFKNKPQYDYYQAGDDARLPQDLIDAGLSAQILGPPIDQDLVSQMTYKNQQYLGAATTSDDKLIVPFASPFKIESEGYPKDAFKFYSAKEIKELVDNSQPDVLEARAAAADKTLNNQSVVVLFSFKGKNLLFAGDAQWGNWENFLYGGAYGTPGHTQLTDKAESILSRIDFYKVGHHGSANATPKDAVAAMRSGCAGMCSTQPGAYNQVPRGPLLAALSEKMNGQLARSDQIAASATEPPTSGIGPLPSKFTNPTGTLFVDYEV
jgi:beta-lactamase superfamily II metal-dependent hydrolase